MTQPTRETPEDLKALLGATLEDATKAASDAGYSVRVSRKDGQACVGTRDLRPDRINLWLIDNKATRADLERALVSGLVELHGTKTSEAARPVPILSIFRPLLEQALAWARPEGLAFGDWSLHRNAARSIEVACVALKIPHCSWNDLRRTHARWLRREGVAVELIGEQLRHAGPTMARRVYARITPGELGEQIEKSLERKGK